MSQSKQGQGVGNDHQVIEHVGQLPHQVVGHQSAQEDEHQTQHGVDNSGFFAEEIHHVDLAEQVPAQDGGESEEEQADRDEHSAGALPKDHAEGGLRQVGLAQGGAGGGSALGQRPALRVQGGDHHQGVQGQDHEGIHKHADHSHHALLMRGGYVGLGVGVGGGAHTGLVGEQAPLCALADGNRRFRFIKRQFKCIRDE